MCTAIAVLDAVRDSGQVPDERFGEVVARISFFVNAGVRFVEEMCKMRAFVQIWDELTRERYGVTDDKQRRFRYGVQVNSLGLTEAQPENNVQRIVLEMLAVTLSKDARARAVQLPGVERGARPAAAMGPAVVAAHPAGARVRERPARVRRPLHRFRRRRDEGGGPRRASARRDRSRAGHGRRRRRGRVRLHEGSARRRARRATRPGRERRGRRRRRQRVHLDRAEPAHREPRHRHPVGRPRCRGRGGRAAADLEVAA